MSADQRRGRSGGKPSPRSEGGGAPRSGGKPSPRSGGGAASRAGSGGGKGRARASTSGPRFAGSTKPSQPTKLPDRPVAKGDSRASSAVHDPDGVRLQKLLAAAGVGSRRACEALITSGRVSVDGHLVTELGVRIDPLRHSVHVDGERVQLDESRVYLAFNKPLGVVSTMHDELGRPSISDFLGARQERLFHVGRLDVDTEGLLLLTNDGDLAHRLQHPTYGVLKTYLAQVPGPVPRDLGKRLRAGIELEDGPVTVDSFKLVDSAPGKALVEVVLHEGRKHVVRRLLEAVGHPVESLVRTDVGPIRLGDLKVGKTRRLTREEVGSLYAAGGL
ncbi:MAG: rRNA pseudouridine synthase [Actinomycetales bacterium]|nr:rRNA pseudouridine synthase [Actinomycetales bacterium]